jgi:DNA repair protein RadC
MITLKWFERSPHLAELKVSYKRRRKVEAGQLAMPWIFASATTAEAHLRSAWDQDTLELVEEVVVVCLNGGHEVPGWVKVSRGGFANATIDPRVIFGVALQAAASAIILAHNHPAGNRDASPEDLRVTRRLVEAGKLLGSSVLDHIILTKDGALSMAEEGLLWRQGTGLLGGRLSSQAFFVGPCYVPGMLKSYIGIAGPNGLEDFRPEDDKTAFALARRVAEAGASRTVSLRAVLPAEDAREACRQIRRGHPVAALTTLDRSAERVGRVLLPEAR